MASSRTGAARSTAAVAAHFVAEPAGAAPAGGGGGGTTLTWQRMPGADRFAEPDALRAPLERDHAAEHAAGDHWIALDVRRTARVLRRFQPQ
jgi:hypothetical protein